jgi:hypothetical protein
MLVFRPEPMCSYVRASPRPSACVRAVPAAGDHCRKRRKDSPMDMNLIALQ